MTLRFWKLEDALPSKGDLDEVGIVDLIQFVGQSRKTGALVLNSRGNEARLFYRKGNLVDARTGRDEGLEALSQIIGWNQGGFEFQPGAMSESPTLELDLTRALMAAAKIRDARKQEEQKRKLEAEERQRLAEEKRRAEEAERLRLAAEQQRKREEEEKRRLAEDRQRLEWEKRWLEEEKHRQAEQKSRLEAEEKLRREEEEAEQEPLDQETSEQIAGWMAKSEFLQHVSLLGADGRLIGEAHAPGAVPNGLRGLSLHLHSFAQRYPRSDMKRVVIEDEAGTVVLLTLPEGRVLIAVADRAASLGIVCMTLGKLTARLTS
jgi:hypothetical protein